MTTVYSDHGDGSQLIVINNSAAILIKVRPADDRCVKNDSNFFHFYLFISKNAHNNDFSAAFDTERIKHDNNDTRRY